MRMITKEKFYRRLVDFHSDRPQFRYGQAAFNLMAHLAPEKAEEHRGGPLDPFHNDSRVDAFVSACLGEES